MKTHPVTAALLIHAATILAATASIPIAEWNPADGSNVGGGIEVPDALMNAPLRGGPASGATIEVSEEAPDGAAIVFSGEQSDCVRTPAGVSLAISEGSTVEMNLLIEETGGEATIFNTQSIEVRYNPTQGNLECIVYLEPVEGQPAYKILRHRFPTDRWGKLVLSIDGTTFTATLNGQVKTATLHASPKNAASAILLGARLLGSSASRPFKGKIGKITISLD